MGGYIERNKKTFFFILISLFIWRIVLFCAQVIGSRWIPQHPGYIGPIPWANMDGIHYLGIAQRGYAQYEQAFFPLFPLVIHIGTFITHNLVLTALIITYVSLFISLFLLYTLVKLDYSIQIAYGSIIFLLFFPTSFFLGSVYTESLFIMFLLGFFLSLRKQQWIFAAILGFCASATRMVGVLLIISFFVELYIQSKNRNMFFQMIKKNIFAIALIPCGMLAYMYYLFVTVKDPLAFIHSQSAFGANRSNGQIILLPQVLFRYMKILLTIPLSNHDFWIALLELVTFLATLAVLLYKWRSIRLSYNIFALLALLIPTLSGTLSSLPRYVLVAFPLYCVLSTIPVTRVKTILLVLFGILLFILTSFFTQGYFIA